MKRSAFASLCGVSKQAIAKHGRHLAVDPEGNVDAAASLANLEGHLDEAKRQRALQVLGAAGGVALTPANAPGTAKAGSAKAEKEAIERDLRLIDLGKATGALVLAADVDASAREAIELMRETFHNARRELAQRICATFDLPTDKAPAVARMLASDFERALGRFAVAAGALAKAGAAGASTDDAHAVRTDAAAEPARLL